MQQTMPKPQSRTVSAAYERTDKQDKLGLTFVLASVNCMITTHQCVFILIINIIIIVLIIIIKYKRSTTLELRQISCDIESNFKLTISKARHISQMSVELLSFILQHNSSGSI